MSDTAVPAKKAKGKTASCQVAKLTVKQDAFAQAYLETGNASEAYRRAYNVKPSTKPETVHEQASRVMADRKVSARVAELQAHHAKRHDVTIDKIVRELALLGFANMQDYIVTQSDGSAYADMSALTRDQAAAIGEITSETYTEGKGEAAREVKRTKFKLLDKRAALVDLGKHLGMFPANVNGTVDHRHHHTAEPLSPFAGHLAQILELRAEDAAEGSLPN